MTVHYGKNAVFYRSRAHYPVAVRGQGVYLWDAQNRRYLDGASGALVANIGHGHPEIADALYQQALQLPFVHGSQFCSDIYAQYAQRLVAKTTGDYRFWACSGGSEATESAIKLARQYHVERGETQRVRLLSREPSYHGASLGALGVSGMGARRAVYAPWLPQDTFPKIPLQASPTELEATLQALNPHTVAAFILEPVTGASDAAYITPSAVLAGYADVCRRHGVLLIADEIMCGMGRAGAWLVSADIQPDIILLGKGLAAGYAPLAGMLAKNQLFDTIMQGSGNYTHGYTYAGHPISLAAGLAVLDVLENGVFEHAQTVSGDLEAGLQTLAAQVPCILEVRGQGMMWGLILGDPHTRQAFPKVGLANRVGQAAMQHGCICYPGSGAQQGLGDHILLGPPLTISITEIDEMLELLLAAFRSLDLEPAL